LDLKFLIFLTDAFIATFGITQPSPRQQRTVALMLGGFLLGALLVVAAIGGFLLWQIHSSGR
jgi:hypothetical protein